MWGKEKLAVLINNEGYCISASSVGRILKNLTQRNLISSILILKAQHIRRRKRAFHAHAKRWQFGMKDNKAGELLQIDYMSIRTDSKYNG